MEELAESQYMKGADQVEKYLLDLIRRYFTGTGAGKRPDVNTREFIVNKAVERMQEEISFDTLGVFSITLPSGETRTGYVELSLADFGGEPEIPVKHSAFNVDFGTEQNTACEGNDPRLSDARKPLPHTHSISEINGLQGQLSTLQGLLTAAGSATHTHSNLNVLELLRYTGDKSVIDLYDLERSQETIENKINTMRNDMNTHKTDIQNKYNAVNASITNIQSDISTLQANIATASSDIINDAKQYSDDSITASESAIQAVIDTLMPDGSLTGLLNTANNAYVPYKTFQVTVSELVDHGTVQVTDASVLSPTITFNDILVDTRLEGTGFSYSLPYIVFKSNTVAGMINIRRDGNVYHADTNVTAADLPADILSAKIVCQYYIKGSLLV